MASKLLGVVGIFIMANYAAGNGQCVASIRRTPRCPPTWSQWQDKCYKVHDADVTWQEGKQQCVELGGVMVVTQSKEELQHLLNMCSCRQYWIGCNDIQTEGTWVCLGEGDIGVDDNRWYSRQPDNQHGDQSCAEVYDYPAGSTSAGWHDRECNLPRKVICQRPKVSSAMLHL
ncbi:C-type lectin domain family 4 member M-like [Asterias amurensis]|uniref:C-type lectin domain family 4 member M-like n=1 Tax=Asterias amurensis TaxID=7602 RepID=UPI003AB287FB